MSNHVAFYLKYRPQTLDELVGQEAVKSTLSSSFLNNKLAHAYLFVGPRGTGKTSTARILAKMVNCEKLLATGDSPLAANSQQPIANSNIPCNKCPTCLSITDGSNLDLIEIDAASNRGIEDIRSLRDKIKLSPMGARKKVYIIDEVHMLTPEAFNALLKTLEEPPKHALFILATTEGSKLPQTILSRVQRLDFKLARPSEILVALEKIIKTEKIDIEEEVLKLLVKRSDGSFRDAVKLLDQLSSTEGKITAKVLEENLKTPLFDNLLDFIRDLFEYNSKEALLCVSKQIENGVDIKEFMLSLMDLLRDLAFVKNGLGEELVKPHFTQDKYEDFVALSDNFSSQELLKVLNILQKATEQLKFASILSLPLELAIVEICTSNPVILSETKDLSTSLRPTSVGDSSSRTPQNDTVETIDGRKSKVVVEDRKIEDREEINLPSSIVHDPSSNNDILKLKEKWTYVLETIRPYNFSLEALLRSISVKECTQEKVYMEVPYSFHQRILEAPKNKDLLESIFSDILGRTVHIFTVLGNRPQRREDIANIEVAGDDEIIRVAAEIFNSDTVN